MTLEEVIRYTKQALEKINPDKRVCTEFRFTVEQVALLLVCLEDYKQLKSDYIDLDHRLRTANTENDELKRMLRLAVDDFQTAMLEEKCKVCDLEHCDYDEICKWRYHDEMMKLLGGNENDND
ncbi:MAG: hypothetical protein UHG68_01525 [Clostridia bacterium]|nr:hypothetical protein [Clostridia bacterium]